MGICPGTLISHFGIIKVGIISMVVMLVQRAEGCPAGHYGPDEIAPLKFHDF